MPHDRLSGGSPQVPAIGAGYRTASHTSGTIENHRRQTDRAAEASETWRDTPIGWVADRLPGGNPPHDSARSRSHRKAHLSPP
jgi:hypothetical protein